MSQHESAVPGWTKSSRCDNDLCLEVARQDRVVAVRDNSRPEIHLSFDDASWQTLLNDLRSGQLDR
ncbi:MAG: DUF397 domain-containing protein [Micromonosporaceae bacterium]|nr:DUF397 domain-containing protein [Micromonosporaceae bacterium]